MLLAHGALGERGVLLLFGARLRVRGHMLIQFWVLLFDGTCEEIVPSQGRAPPGRRRLQVQLASNVAWLLLLRPFCCTSSKALTKVGSMGFSFGGIQL